MNNKSGRSIVAALAIKMKQMTKHTKQVTIQSFRNGLLPLFGFGIVLGLNILFYQWPQGDTFYIILEFAFFSGAILTRYWDPKKSRLMLFTGVTLMTFVISLDMIFYLLILLYEGGRDIIGAVIFAIDCICLVALIYWAFIYRI